MYVHVVVKVSIMSSTHIQVNEDNGFVEICVQADHQTQTVYEVTLSTIDNTALGKLLSLVHILSQIS